MEKRRWNRGKEREMQIKKNSGVRGGGGGEGGSEKKKRERHEIERQVGWCKFLASSSNRSTDYNRHRPQLEDQTENMKNVNQM